jgi:hypothetical protein
MQDSTRFERTQKLLQKYDPDFAPPHRPARPAVQQSTHSPRRAGSSPQPKQQQQRQSQAAVPMSPLGAVSSRAMSMAATTMHGAGSKMFPLLGQLWSHAANNLIGECVERGEGWGRGAKKGQH